MFGSLVARSVADQDESSQHSADQDKVRDKEHGHKDDLEEAVQDKIGEGDMADHKKQDILDTD